MSEPLVSVIVDTYNHADFIAQAIDSVLSQQFPREDMEIIVVDDGSKDDTPARVRAFGSRVQYFQKPNGGQASALNFAMGQARGSIVAFLDGDDYWLPVKLSRVAQAFSDHPDAGMVYHQLVELTAASGEQRLAGFHPLSGFLPSDARKLAAYVVYATSSLAFRRETLLKLLPIPNELTIQADAYLASLVIFEAPIVAIPEALGVYRIHRSNLFHNGEGPRSDARARRRVATREVLIRSLNEKLSLKKAPLGSGIVQPYLKRWQLLQEEEVFSLDEPGRWKLARHLAEYTHYFRHRWSWRYRIFSYLCAFVSLWTGYRGVSKMEQWRRGMGNALRKFSGSASQREGTGTSQVTDR
jgi:glycosyltransferase involved in cell wall biosynthesis